MNARHAVAVALAGLLAPLLAGLSWLGPPPAHQESDVWTNRIDQGVRAEAARIRGPKIVFVGCSNLIFGLRADSLSRRVGLPVVNYGLFAGIGLDYAADRAAEIVGPGDIVILAPEHINWWHAGPHPTGYREDWLRYLAAERDAGKDRAPLFSLERARRGCTQLRRALHERFMAIDLGRSSRAAVPFGPYDVQAIGADGQLHFPRPQSVGFAFEDPPSSPKALNYTDSWAVNVLARLPQLCRERGATFVVMPPFRLAQAGSARSDFLLDHERRWMGEAVARGALQLLAPGETVLPPEFGYDSEYHLNDRGVAIMEKKLVAALAPLLEGHPQPGKSLSQP